MSIASPLRIGTSVLGGLFLIGVVELFLVAGEASGQCRDVPKEALASSKTLPATTSAGQPKQERATDKLQLDNVFGQARSDSPKRANIVTGGQKATAADVDDESRSVLTQHNDNQRTGAYLYERELKPDSLLHKAFGVKYFFPVDGAVNAQLLYVRGVVINGVKRNVVYAATMNNSVYALDADSDTSPIWKVTLKDDDPMRKLARGILSTPVIDFSSRRMYLIYSTKNERVESSCPSADKWCKDHDQVVEESALAGLNVAFWLAAIDIRNGQIVGHVRITGDVARDSGGALRFLERDHINRAGLLLEGDSVYIAFAARQNEDFHEYHGWIMRYDSGSLRQTAVFNTSRNWVFAPPMDIDHTSPGDIAGAGVWQSGAGLVSDNFGNIYFSTGNGKSEPTHGYFGDMILKLSASGGQMILSGEFAPSEIPREGEILDQQDLDLGSGGLMMIPGSSILVGGGKTGIMYLLDSRNPNSAVQKFVFSTNQYDSSQRYAGGETPHLHGAAAYWQVSDTCGYIFDWGEKDYLRGYPYYSRTGQVDQNHPILGDVLTPPMLMPGGSVSVSGDLNDSSSGIVWATSPTGEGGGGLFVAFDANTLARLWVTPLQALSHFQPPTIADGKVFIATELLSPTGLRAVVEVYGLLPQPLLSERTPRLMQQELDEARAVASAFNTSEHIYPPNNRYKH